MPTVSGLGGLVAGAGVEVLGIPHKLHNQVPDVPHRDSSSASWAPWDLNPKACAGRCRLS